MKEYYSKGSSEDIVVSNSSLSAINPIQGGSPREFLEFLDNKEEEVNRYKNTGTLIHDFAENPKDFHTLEVDKPSDKLGEVADLVLEYYKVIDEPEDPDTIILNACRNIGWNPKWGDAAILKNAVPVILPYVDEAKMLHNEGKKPMTKSVREIVDGAITSLQNHELAREMLFDNTFSDNIYLTDQEVYWKENLTTTRNSLNEEVKIMLDCKALLDKAIINVEKKIIFINDLKSHGQGSIYTYGPNGENNGFNSFEKYRVYRQLAWYGIAIGQYMKQNNIPYDSDWNVLYNIVVVQTTKPYSTGVINVPMSWIYKGRKEALDLCERIAWHSVNKIWDKSYEEYRDGGYIRIKNYGETK